MSESHEPNPQPSPNPEPVNWQAYIPEDLKDKGVWEPIKNADLPTVLKSYAHAQERLGRSITLPDENDQEGWQKVYNRLGRPESPDKYEFELPSIQGWEWDSNEIGEFKKVAHEAGLTPKQVKMITDWYGASTQNKVMSQFDSLREKAAVTEAKLRRELGKEYDIEIALAKKAGYEYFGEEVTDSIIDTMDEAAVRGLMKLGRQLAEDKSFHTVPELQGVTTKEKAQEEISKMLSDREGPYLNARHPDHDKALERFVALQELLLKG